MKTQVLGTAALLFFLLGSRPALTEDTGAADRDVAAGKGSSDGDYVIEKKDGKTIKYKRKTTYDFEGASIEGVYNKPSGSYISNIKDVKGKSILKIRENFDAEVIDSARLAK